MANKRSHPKRSFLQHTRIIAALVVVIIIVGIFFWFHGRHTSKKTQVTPSSMSTITPPVTSASTTTPTPNSNVPGGSTGSTLPAQTELATPSGQFVSNHSPSMSPADPRSNEVSVCNTTVGATCEIKFTADTGQVVSLGASTVTASKDAGSGQATWSWTPTSVGLTAGTWHITAVAVLSSQTKTTTDPVLLRVSP